MSDTIPNGSHPTRAAEGITKIAVGGYKSISNEQSIDVRPLTLLAGVNSSGKSSIMQPLLLMKQTLEASYDPGALLLDGPNVAFTSASQLLSHESQNQRNSFSVVLRMGDSGASFVFRKPTQAKFIVERLDYLSPKRSITLFKDGMTHEQIMEVMSLALDFHRTTFELLAQTVAQVGSKFFVVEDRCFLRIATKYAQENVAPIPDAIISYGSLERAIREVIHLPGLRGNPARTYPFTAVGSTFQGTFDNYTASIIAQWQSDKEFDKLEQLRQSLIALGLTSAVAAQPLNDTQVELKVGRLPGNLSGEQDMVSIADVGFGVSQTLPVLVALLVAKPGQIVYLEQPEIHLHPRAQVAMAHVLADAAKRGVRVVAETHSSLLLLGVQTLVAEGELSPELVKLHWFARDQDGATAVRSADLDETGAFGEWPEDFADVTLQAESRYLDAAEKHLMGR